MSTLKPGSKLVCVVNTRDFTFGKIYEICKYHSDVSKDDCIIIINDRNRAEIFSIEKIYGKNYETWFKLLCDVRREKIKKLNKKSR